MLSDPHIQARFSRTDKQLAHLFPPVGSVDVLMGLMGCICAACCSSQQPEFLQPRHRSGVPAACRLSQSNRARHAIGEGEGLSRLASGHFPSRISPLAVPVFPVDGSSVHSLGFQFPDGAPNMTGDRAPAVSDKMGILRLVCLKAVAMATLRRQRPAPRFTLSAAKEVRSQPSAGAFQQESEQWIQIASLDLICTRHNTDKRVLANTRTRHLTETSVPLLHLWKRCRPRQQR